MRASAVGIDYTAMTARAAQMLQENESKAGVKRAAEGAADGAPPAKASAGADGCRCCHRVRGNFYRGLKAGHPRGMQAHCITWMEAFAHPVPITCILPLSPTLR